MNIDIIKHDNFKEVVIKNNNNFTVKLLTIGATILEIKCLDKIGNLENVVLRYKNPYDFIKNEMYLNCCIGPYAGRIANANFKIDNKKYLLNKNEGNNCLHSGKSIQNKNWDLEFKREKDKILVVFTTKLNNLENGFPGESAFKVVYTVFDKKNILLIENYANSNRDTIFNLTHHTYFNLSGNLKRKIFDHYLQFDSKFIFEMDKHKIPALKVRPNRLFNFSKNRKLNFVENFGIDHLFELGKNKIYLLEKKSGRKLSITTSLPNVVIYSQNNLTPSKLKGKKSLGKHLGLAIETQFESNEINSKTENMKTFFKKEKPYYSKTEYLFEIMQN